MTWCMAKKIEAYADTSAFIAFADRSDSYHSLFRQLFSAPPSIITTAMVVAEGHAWFLKRYDRMRALQFMAMIEDMTFLHVLATAEQELMQGAAMLRRFSDQDLTLVDAVGLSVMAVRRVRACWSTDFHLGLTGVPLVIHEH
jgi:predicted nucleic acid-binding protein